MATLWERTPPRLPPAEPLPLRGDSSEGFQGFFSEFCSEKATSSRRERCRKLFDFSHLDGLQLQTEEPRRSPQITHDEVVLVTGKPKNRNARYLRHRLRQQLHTLLDHAACEGRHARDVAA